MITKCYGKGCKKQMTCYRVIAPPERHQAYYADNPLKRGTCTEYIDKAPQESCTVKHRHSDKGVDHGSWDNSDVYFNHLKEQAG